MAGTALPTNPVYVQDLAVWLPLVAVAAWWLWQRQRRGLLVVGAILTTWVLEPVTIAVDQWLGHAADPTSPVVSDAVVVPMLTLAVLTAVPLWLFLRSVRRSP